MRKYTQVVILCEDRQQEVFARYFLIKCGIDRKRIRVNIAPRGTGSGEQFVRENYPAEVKSLRSRSYLNISLLIMIDADPENSVGNRLAQLDDALARASLDRRHAGEKIALIVPKRNIETWIHYFNGTDINETDDYPKLAKASDCKPAVEKAADCRNGTLPDNAPDSLKRACMELHRILPKASRS